MSQVLLILFLKAYGFLLITVVYCIGRPVIVPIFCSKFIFVQNQYVDEQLAGKNSHHIIEATFKAFARALRQATEYDPRRLGSVPRYDISYLLIFILVLHFSCLVFGESTGLILTCCDNVHVFWSAVQKGFYHVLDLLT